MTNQTKMKHTELPWILINEKYNVYIEVKNNDYPKYPELKEKLLLTGVSLTCGNHPRQKEAEANAEFIVKACNNHAKLVEACKEAIEIIEDVHGTDESALHILKQALKESEG